MYAGKNFRGSLSVIIKVLRGRDKFEVIKKTLWAAFLKWTVALRDLCEGKILGKILEHLVEP